MALESWVLGNRVFSSGSRLLYPTNENRPKRMFLGRNSKYPFPIVSNCVSPTSFLLSSYGTNVRLLGGARLRMRCMSNNSDCSHEKNAVPKPNLKFIHEMLVKKGIILAATVCGVLVFGCPKVFALEGVVNAGYGVIGQSILLLKSTWPIMSKVLRLFKEQGLLLALLLGLSAFFSLAETSITTLWPWKVSCLFSLLNELYFLYVSSIKVGAMLLKTETLFSNHYQDIV